MRLLLSFLLMCLVGVAQAQTANNPFAQPDFLPVN